MKTLLRGDSAFVQSHSDKPITEPLQEVMGLLDGLDCEFLRFRWSRNDVPHIVLQFHSQTYSVCYFRHTKTYRVFFPYGTGDRQEHQDFGTAQEIVDFISYRKEEQK